MRVESLPPRSLTIFVVEYEILGRQLAGQNGLRQFLELAKRGHHVTYVAASTFQQQLPNADVPGFKFKTIQLGGTRGFIAGVYFELIAFWNLLRSIGRTDVVIMDPYSFRMLLPLVILCRALNHSLVWLVRVRSIPVETQGLVRTLAWAFAFTLSVKIASRLCHKVAFISPLLAREYIHRFRIPPERTFVWPPCVDMHVFDPMRIAGDRTLRGEMGGLDRLLILYHGALSKGRGIMELLEAFRILSQESLNVGLVLLGSGLEEEVHTYLRRQHLEGIVRVHAPVDYVHVPDYLAASDAEIVTLPNHPWWRYQCPIKVLECLAMNKPLILSDIPANRSIVGDAPVALYTKGTSASEIADGIRAFVASRNNLNPELGRRIAWPFSAERIAEVIECQIQSVLPLGQQNALSRMTSQFQSNVDRQRVR